MRWLLVVVCLVIGSLAHSQIAGNPLQPVWRPYRSGEQSQIKEAKTFVLQSANEFSTYWQEAFGTAAPTDIDWQKNYAVAIHLGTRTSGGYKVFVESVNRVHSSEVRVAYVELTPDGMATTVMTSPWAVITLERTSAVGRVSFFKSTRKNPNQTQTRNAFGTRYRIYMCEQEGGGDRRRELLINNHEEFQEYWRSAFGSAAPTGDINWREESIVAMHAGPQATTGYLLLIDWIEPVRDGIGVRYALMTPAVGQKTKKQATSPYLLIRVPKIQGRAYFERRTWSGEG